MVKAEVLQGSVLGPLIYLLYTMDIPKLSDNIITTFVDDNGLLSVGDIVNSQLQSCKKIVYFIINWKKKWPIKLNESKSVF